MRNSRRIEPRYITSESRITSRGHWLESLDVKSITDCRKPKKISDTRRAESHLHSTGGETVGKLRLENTHFGFGQVLTWLGEPGADELLGITAECQALQGVVAVRPLKASSFMLTSVTDSLAVPGGTLSTGEGAAVVPGGSTTQPPVPGNWGLKTTNANVKPHHKRLVGPHKSLSTPENQTPRTSVKTGHSRAREVPEPPPTWLRQSTESPRVLTHRVAAGYRRSQSLYPPGRSRATKVPESPPIWLQQGTGSPRVHNHLVAAGHQRSQSIYPPGCSRAPEVPE